MALSEENINMDNEVPDGTTEGLLCDEGNPASKVRDSSLDEEEMDAQSTSDELHENSSDDEEGVVSKINMRQTTKTLDDPSQFYFDDDIPTPGSSEEYSDEEDDVSDDEDKRREDRKEFDEKEEHIENSKKGERRDKEEYEVAGRDEEMDDEEGSIIMDESEEESEIEGEESDENDRESSVEDNENDDEVVKDDENKYPERNEEMMYDSDSKDDNDDDKSVSNEDKSQSDESRSNAYSESEIEDKKVPDKESYTGFREKIIDNDNKIDEDLKHQSFSPIKTGCDSSKSIMKEGDACIGFKVRQIDLKTFRLKREILLSCINTIERFLNPNLSAKEWKGVIKTEIKFREQLDCKQRQPMTNNFQKIAVKRKRSVEESQDQVVVKKDGRGRPKGWRKYKPETVETALQDCPKGSPKTKVEEKPIVKRSKKDQMLLLKALDEEMFKMDEENNKEMERISQGLEYQCSVCNQVFIEKKNLSKHFFKCLMKFTQSGRSSFKCAVCFEYFSLLESLETHIEKKHCDVCDDPFQCAQCSLCFNEGSTLKAHVLEKHEVFQCGHCEKYYRTQAMLDVHVSKKHDGVNVKSESSTGETSKGRKRKDEVVMKIELDGEGRAKRGLKRNSQTNKVSSQASASSQSPAKIIQDYDAVQVKLEPLETSIVTNVKKENPMTTTFDRQVKSEAVTPTEPVPKKKGRPFKKKSLNEKVDIPKNNAPMQSVKTSPTKYQVTAVPSISASKPEASNISSTEEASSEETELGRGRRLKKKKALDYEDISLPVRAVSKSTDRTTAASQKCSIKKKDDIDCVKLEFNKTSFLSKSNVFGDVKIAANKATALPKPNIFTIVKMEDNKQLALPKPTVSSDIKTEARKATVLSQSTVYGRPLTFKYQPTLNSQPIKTPVQKQPLIFKTQNSQQTKTPVEQPPLPFNTESSKNSQASKTPLQQPPLNFKLQPSQNSQAVETSPQLPMPISVNEKTLINIPKVFDSTPSTEASQETLPSPLPVSQTSDQSTHQHSEESTAPTTIPKRKVHLCPKCRKAFAHKYLVKVHMKWKHNIYKRKTVIDPAIKSGGADGNDLTRKRAHHRTPISARGALFDCTLCGQSYAKFSILDDHYLREHDGIPCAICRILIKNRYLLDKHLTSCHSEEDRFVCPVCDKRMASKATLRKHLAMHEDRRPYDCSVCKRSFRYSYDMRLHMRRTHKRDLERVNEALSVPVVTNSVGDGDV